MQAAAEKTLAKRAAEKSLKTPGSGKKARKVVKGSIFDLNFKEHCEEIPVVDASKADYELHFEKPFIVDKIGWLRGRSPQLLTDDSHMATQATMFKQGFLASVPAKTKGRAHGPLTVSEGSMMSIKGMLKDVRLMSDLGSTLYNGALNAYHFFGYTGDMVHVGVEANALDSCRYTLQGKRLVVIVSAHDVLNYCDKFMPSDIVSVSDKLDAMKSRLDCAEFADLCKSSAGIFFGHIVPQTMLWVPAGYVVAEKVVRTAPRKAPCLIGWWAFAVDTSPGHASVPQFCGRPNDVAIDFLFVERRAALP
jgi:hypothetical protein